MGKKNLLADFTKWVGDQPKNKKYEYTDPYGCAISQFLQQKYPDKKDIAVLPEEIIMDGKSYSYPYEINLMVLSKPRTFGSLHESLLLLERT